MVSSSIDKNAAVDEKSITVGGTGATKRLLKKAEVRQTVNVP